MRSPSYGTRREFLWASLVGATAYLCGPSAPASQKPPSIEDVQLLELTAGQAVMLLKTGDLLAERYAMALLAQCRRLRDINAFIWLDETRVLEDARAADKRRRSGAKPGPLHGLPIAVKDNIDTANAPTSAGTPALRTHRPTSDAPAVKALFSADAILLGKTNMHELAYGITSNNADFGPVRNPYDRSLIAGGSSGGTGAAIAARMCSAGLGTDTGGSVRIPAALCGIVGLRPTVGRYPGKGIVPISHTRDTAGPMARSVQDLVLFDSVITGDFTPVPPASLEGTRIGVPRGLFYGHLDSEMAPVIEAALTALRDAGCVLVEADIPDVEQLSIAATAPISFYESLHDLTRYLGESGSSITAKDIVEKISSPDVRAIYDTFILGPKAPPREAYLAALENGRPALQAAYRNYFAAHNVSAIVFPTTPLPARPIGQDGEVELNGKKVSTLFTYLRNARPASTAGIPGISLPAGLTAQGLPVGLEFDAAAGNDRNLLGLCLAAERVFGTLAAPRL